MHTIYSPSYYVRDTSILRSAAHRLVFITLLLLIIGSISIYSASCILALDMHHDSFYFVKKQLYGYSVACILLVTTFLLRQRDIEDLIPYAYSASLILTVCTLIPSLSTHIHGSSRWLNVGISLQPSELLVVATIMMIGTILSRTALQREQFFAGLILPLCYVLPPSIILLLQPDFGMVCTLLVTVFIMLYTQHARIKHVSILAAATVPMLGALIVISKYRLQRILTFLDPWQDPTGSGFQIVQSLIAIGSGGLYGIGIGQSHQKFFYLPMQHTDFIFSIIAEETGFIGSCIIILLFCTLLYYGFIIARHLSTITWRSITTGFISLITIRALLNIAVGLGNLPTKGVPLPFISYGNTNLIAHLLMIGLIVHATRS